MFDVLTVIHTDLFCVFFCDCWCAGEMLQGMRVGAVSDQSMSVSEAFEYIQHFYNAIQARTDTIRNTMSSLAKYGYIP
jgi:hypothetical protein